MSPSCLSHHSGTMYLLTRTHGRKHELFSFLLLAELEGIACELQFFDLFSWWAKQHGHFFLNKWSLNVKQLLRKQKVLCEILTFRPAAQAYTMSCASFRVSHAVMKVYRPSSVSLLFPYSQERWPLIQSEKWNGKISLNPGLLTCPIVQQLLFS